MVFNVISTIFQLHRGGQLHRWRKLEHSGEKTTDLPQVTGKLNHIMLYQVCELTTLVVIGTDYIGSCKSNYHRVTTMTAPISSSGIENFNLLV